MTQTLPLFLVIPAVAAVLVFVLGRRSPGVADGLALLGTLGLSLMSFLAIGKSGVFWAAGHVPAGSVGLGLSLVLDASSVVMLLTANLVALLVSLYSIPCIEPAAKAKYYGLLLLAVLGANGVILTGDLLSLFVFVALVSFVYYAFMAGGSPSGNPRAAAKYLAAAGVGAALVIVAALITFGLTGSFNMAQIAKTFGSSPGAAHMLVFALFIAGLGFQAGIFPFHAWLPDVSGHVPTPFSAMACGALTKTVGIYALVRVLFEALGVTPLVLGVLLVLGTLSVLVGSIVALGQDDLKRMLSWHTVSEMGYVVAGFGLGTRLGIAAALFHMINHAVAKTLLCFNAGAIEYATGTTAYRQMGDVKHRAPITGATSMIGSLSISGIPPFGGFWSKLFILAAAVQAERYGYAGWLTAGSILTIASFARFQKQVLHDQPAEAVAVKRRIPALMQITALALAVLCVAMGLLWIPQIRESFFIPAAQIIQEGIAYGARVLGA